MPLFLSGFCFFFAKKNQKLCIIVSICPIVSWVGAFESLDDEATFFILLYGDARYGKFSRDPQNCQRLLMSWNIWVYVEKTSILYKFLKMNHKISKSWQLWGSLEKFLYVLSPYNKMKKAASSSELSNAPTHETIGQIETIIDKFFFWRKKPKSAKKRRHPL